MKKLPIAGLTVLLLFILAGCDLFAVKDTSTEPPQLVVLTESGRIRAQRFGFQWETSATSVIADSVDPSTYAYEPIRVTAGETLQLAYEEGKAPQVFTLWFYPGGEEERIAVSYELNRGGDDPRFAEDAVALFEVSESGVYVVEALWPSWVKDGINGEAFYGFAVSVEPQ